MADTYKVVVSDQKGNETAVYYGLSKEEAELRVEELSRPMQSAFYQKEKR